MGFEIINILKKEKGLTNAQIAKMSGITLSTLDKITSGVNTNPKLDTLQSICKVLGCTLNDFAGVSSNAKKAPPYSSEAIQLAQDYDDLDEHGQRVIRIVADEELNRIKKILTRNQSQPEMAEEFETNVNKFIRLRFSELKASAGTGYQLDDDQTTTWKVLYNEFTRMADFCLEVDGQSMAPRICDGDIILIRQQPSVEIGEIGLFTVNDTGYVKKQGKDRLISINREFPDVFPNEYDTVFCRGKVIGVLDPAWIVEQ